MYSYLLRAGLGAAIGYGVGALPDPINVIAGCLCAAWFFRMVWRAYPRSCVHCGSRPTLAVRRDQKAPVVIRPWWDIRFPPRNTYNWVCVEHLVTHNLKYFSR